MTLRKEESVTAPDNFVPAKPKGKAKFIGTSKEEREMALILIEKIRKKGNPTGNNLQCRICDPPRSFTAPTTLVSHYRSHAGIKPYECRICRSVFTRRHSLKYHMLIHQNQTRFTCTDCEKKFRHPSHFREHRRRHTGEAPFGCEDCGQRYVYIILAKQGAVALFDYKIYLFLLLLYFKYMILLLTRRVHGFWKINFYNELRINFCYLKIKLSVFNSFN